MSFEIGRVYVLDFEGSGLEGAIVKMRSPSISTIEKISSEEIDERTAFAEHLVEWNFTADGQEVPPSLAGFKMLEPAAGRLLLKEWGRAAWGISAPLERSSDVGESSPAVESTELSIPMESL